MNGASQVMQTVIEAIRPVDATLAPGIQARLDDLTKPPGSLGRLETLALRYALVQGSLDPRLGDKRICCFAGDHGVADAGVSAYPRAVTAQMVRNMLAGGAAINVLARHAGAGLEVIDIGVDDDLADAPGLCRRKVARGTANLAQAPAMTLAQTVCAIDVGIERARDAAAQGVCLLGTGEMGIANTTPATALFAAYLDLPPAGITGRGTGIDDAGLRHKIGVIEQALARHAERLTDPLATLATLGGLEIAGLCGLVLGGAAARLAVVVDGFISTAAALAAMRLQPAVADYLFFSHRSREQGHARILDALGVAPVLDLDMRLGEGTGAALAMTVIEASVKLYREMATFSGAGISGK